MLWVRESYQILKAADGLAGVQIAEERKPDLILLDLKAMPFDGAGQQHLKIIIQDIKESIEILCIHFALLKRWHRISAQKNSGFIADFVDSQTPNFKCCCPAKGKNTS